MKFTTLVDLSLVITIYLVCLINAWVRNNAFSLHDSYGHTPAQEPLPKGSCKFTILVDPSLVIITTYLVSLIYTWE